MPVAKIPAMDADYSYICVEVQKNRIIMKTFLPILLFLAALLPGGLFAQLPSGDIDQPEELVWHTDLVTAVQESQKTGKPLFAFFTGSDWCGWCKRLQANVFYKPAFKEWAPKNVVLLELDFPRRTQLPPKLAQQNTQLRNMLQVSGYPTIWVLDPVYNADRITSTSTKSAS